MHLHCQLYLIYFRVWFLPLRFGLYGGCQKLVSNSLFHVSDMDLHGCFLCLISKHFCHIPRFQKLKLGTLLFYLSTYKPSYNRDPRRTLKHQPNCKTPHIFNRPWHTIYQVQQPFFPDHPFPPSIISINFSKIRTTSISSIPDTFLNNPPSSQPLSLTR